MGADGNVDGRTGKAAVRDQFLRRAAREQGCLTPDAQTAVRPPDPYEQRGRLVVPSLGIYCATKFALEAMAETLRYEVSQLGIDSVTVEPGAYPTAIGANAADAADPARAVDYGSLAEAPRKLRDAFTAVDT